MSFERVSGPQSDRYDCFNIRDFRKNDSIIVLTEGSRRMRGVVTSIDESSNLIHFRSGEGEFVTDIEGIVFLDNFRRDWLEGA